MIRIIIDNQVSEIKEDTAKKIREALSAILSTLPPNRIVTEILMDGEKISQTENNGSSGNKSDIYASHLRNIAYRSWLTKTSTYDEYAPGFILPDRPNPTQSWAHKCLTYFRTSPKNLDSHLENVKELSIRTADKKIWETNGLEIAQTSVERIQQSLVRAAQLLREERKAEANRFFMRCIEGLERFIETIAITRHALQLDFETITIDSVSLARTETQFMNILKSILRSQEERDLDSVADKVEYELLPNLGFWSKAIQQLRCSQEANA